MEVAWKGGRYEAIASQRREIETPAWAHQARTHRHVSSVQSTRNDFVRFGQQLVNEEVLKRIGLQGRGRWIEKLQFSEAVCVPKKAHQLHATELRYDDHADVGDCQRPDER